jgi:hypothetical protein
MRTADWKQLLDRRLCSLFDGISPQPNLLPGEKEFTALAVPPIEVVYM